MTHAHVAESSRIKIASSGRPKVNHAAKSATILSKMSIEYRPELTMNNRDQLGYSTNSVNNRDKFKIFIMRFIAAILLFAAVVRGVNASACSEVDYRLVFLG